MFSECGVTRAGLELGVPKHSARRPIVGTQVVGRGPHAATQRATRRLAARHCLDRSRSAWLDRTQNTRPRGQLTGLYSRDSKIAGAPWRSCLTNVCPLRNSSSVAEGKGEAYEICGVRPDRIAAIRVPRLASAKKSGFCERHGSCQAGARSPAESGTIRLATEWVQWLCEACIKLPPRLSQEVTLTAEPGRIGKTVMHNDFVHENREDTRRKDFEIFSITGPRFLPDPAFLFSRASRKPVQSGSLRLMFLEYSSARTLNVGSEGGGFNREPG
jgi:hypothetical protein